MTPERHEQVKRLFLAACELDERRRAGFLDEACAGDPGLRAEVESLLAHHDPATLLEAARPASPTDDQAVPPRIPIAALSKSATTSSTVAVVREAGFSAGDIIAGRYRIVGTIGHGGMGHVYRADDLRLDQPVALKFLSRGLTRNPVWIARLQNEVRLARRVTHPNVCRVHDIIEVDGEPFISMEYVDGEDLASLLRRIGRLPRAKAVEIAQQICAGLAAAHRQSVLHRDLKPSNIMIDGRGQVRITDFGIATLAAPGEFEGEIAGTLNYMSPEVLDGRPASVQSDVYSLGVVLYEMITGRAAFAANTLEARRQQPTPPQPSLVVDEVEPAVERLIMRCLEAEPSDRPPSMYTVAAALPGGDALAVALAAGETPSPETVAAARVGGLKPRTAAACFGCALLGLAAVVFLADRTYLIPAVGLPLSSDVLRHTAEEIVAQLGAPEITTDVHHGFVVDPSRPASLAHHAPNGDETEASTPSSWPALLFEYRVRPAPAPPDGPLTRPEPADLDVLAAGAYRVRLDPGGALRSYAVVPGREFGPHDQEAEPNWSLLFERAGLAFDSFSRVTPHRWPPVPANESLAWEARSAGRGAGSVHVEAATLDGQVVYFDVSRPDTHARSEATDVVASAGSLTAARIRYLLFLVTMSGGLVLVLQNLRRGLGDPRGAWRLAAFMLGAEMLYWVLRHPHKPEFVAEVGWGVVSLRFAVFAAAMIWLYYVAAEPYVRRLWPRSIVSWSRVLAGRWRDPAVGGDILIGGAVGIGVVLLRQVGVLLPDRMGEFSSVPLLPEGDGILGSLVGFRYVFGILVGGLVMAVWRGFVAVVVMLLLRVTLRRTEVTFIAFVLVATAVFAWTTDHAVARPWLTFGLIVVGLGVLLTRVGLLAAVVSLFTSYLLLNSPMTSDFGAWYAGSAGFVIFVLVGLWMFGLYCAVRVRPV